jgi:hypothetical protein
MIDPNSNCSRVDAVKAAATQIKLQTPAPSASPTARAADPNDAARKVQGDLQTLDGDIKSNDAKKAELALAVAKKDIAAAATTSQPASYRPNSRGMDAYA